MREARAPAIRVIAPAKLNLYLHVVGRREDGYHELDSLVAFADIADVVTAGPAETLSLTTDGPFAAALATDTSENLVLRAARLLAARLGITPAAALNLSKNLPVASGIGGGSSDAAAALLALCRVWRARLGAGELAELAVKLGADVPVCLRGHATWLGGIGDALVPATHLPDVAVVLANPGIALPTTAVFKARRGPFSQPARFEEAIADAQSLAATLQDRRNDLTEAAIQLVPDISDVLADLAESEGALLARMSGSGATCFALYTTDDEADRAARRMARQRPQWWVKSGRLTTRSAQDSNELGV
jgi:4-diphosphocytidyl-2-C-methyl-D-erythritol kinase